MNPADFFTTEHLLENNRVRLEPLQEKHYALLLPIAMEKVLWQFTSNTIVSESDFRKYFDTALAERLSGIAYPFAVFDKLNNCYGGCTRYGNIAFAHKRMEIGWTWYAPNLQGSGINKACKSLLLNFGFNNLQLNRIELKTSLLNLKSQAAMLKIGAVKEGILRNHMITESGTVRNTVYFSFIKEEWPQVKNGYGL
jgi:RimJ/RimL family protein N-acetyltransferase